MPIGTCQVGVVVGSAGVGSGLLHVFNSTSNQCPDALCSPRASGIHLVVAHVEIVLRVLIASVFYDLGRCKPELRNKSKSDLLCPHQRLARVSRMWTAVVALVHPVFQAPVHGIWFLVLGTQIVVLSIEA